MKKILIPLFLLFSINSFSQEISCDNASVVDAYNLAVNTVNINVRRGILAAGAEYGGEWARDISINSWFGVSLLNPKVAEASLWSVTENKDKIGHQYWDRIIWVISALNHYKVTGDEAFLKKAFTCSANSMTVLEKEAWDAQYGMFTGPSVFNDGIAGYPAPVWDSTNGSGFVLDHKNAKVIKCLSTNCVYYGAYLSLIEMGQILKVDKAQLLTFQTKADALKANILKNLYSEADNKLYYLIDNTGAVAKYQEGLGVSFAIIFGILTNEQTQKLLKDVKVSKYGITSIYPDFARFSPDKPGRHNNIIWPMVNGFFAQAAIKANNKTSFDTEFNGLTKLALDQDKGNYQFWEIYNPYTGKPDGGWQGAHWHSCMIQTWSATAYMNMIEYGVAGLRFDNNGISFVPYLPENIHNIELRNIKYRQSVLNVAIKGKGSKIKLFTVNGKAQSNYKIDATAKGVNTIQIELE